MVWTGNLGAAAWNPSKPKEKSLNNWCGREIILQKNRLCAHKNWCGHQIPPLAATASQTVRKWRCLCAPAESLSKPFGQHGDTLRNPTSFYSNRTNERGSQKKVKNGIPPTIPTLFNSRVHLGKCLCPKLGNCGLVGAFGRLESVRATFARLAASHLVLVALRRANDAAFSSGGSGLRPIVVSGGGLRGRQQCWPFCASVCVVRRYWGKKGVFLAGSQRET